MHFFPAVRTSSMCAIVLLLMMFDIRREVFVYRMFVVFDIVYICQIIPISMDFTSTSLPIFLFEKILHSDLDFSKGIVEFFFSTSDNCTQCISISR